MLSHLSRKHPSFKDYSGALLEFSACDEAEAENCDSGSSDEADYHPGAGGCDTADLSSIDKENICPTSSRNHSSSESAALFLLTLKEKHRLTQVSVDFALGHIKQMTNCIVQDLQCKVEKYLGDANIQYPDISSCFSDINPFKGLETEHLQSKFYKNHFNLIVSNHN